MMKKFIFIFLTLTAIYGNAQLTDRQKEMMKQMGINATNPADALKQMQQMNKNGQHPDFTAGGQKLVDQMKVDPKSYDSSMTKYHYFASNVSLIPAKDVSRINIVSKKIFSNAEMLSNTQLLYRKMMAKIPASEREIITSVTSQSTASDQLGNASVTAMMQGHNIAALGIAMHAVITNPGNLNCQNNMAALLTQNGYPESAIPYLNTIQQQLPNNSTVLNNLGYAWLNLGATDSAQRILTAAALLNPENPETTTAVGVIEEKNGNTEAAGKNYEQAFDQAPSSMIEIMLGHVGKPNPTLEYMQKTYDQFKDKLTIYEYFKKEWETIPDFSNNVNGYLKDYGLSKGYEQMFKSIGSKFKKIVDSVEKLKDADMFAVNIGPNSRMAGYANTAIGFKIRGLMSDFMYDGAALEEYVKAAYKNAEDKAWEVEKNETKCGVGDPFWNQYLQQVNPVIQQFHKTRIAKFRVLINAFISTALLIHRKPRRQDLRNILYYSEIFMGKSYFGPYTLTYRQKGCPFDANLDNDITPVEEYQLPKLFCPISTNPTSGSQNNSNTPINKSASGTVPNATIAMGSNDGGVAEPGKTGTPFVKTSQGDVSSFGYNGQDAYWDFQQGITQASDAPSPFVSKAPPEDDLTPLAKQVKQEENYTPSVDPKTGYVDDLAPLTKTILKHSLKQWLQNRLGTNCDDLNKFSQNPSNPKLPDLKAELTQDMQNLQNKVDQLNQQNDPANAEQIASGKFLQGEIAKAQQNIDQKNQTDPGWVDKISAVVPTIVNSLQNPSSITGYIKGLFN